jgi:hypothetical protein
MQRRLLWTALILGCVVLFGYSLIRMIRLSFTHDESLTYTILLDDPTWRGSANNHPLNTRTMRWARHWLGDQEWALRLPNLIAHGLYLISGMFLLRRFGSWAVLLLGFGLLNLNAFLLDFFGLARGYGLASGLSLTSLWLLKEAWDRMGTSSGRALIFLSFTFAALAPNANFAWVNVHVAMMSAAIVFCIGDYRKVKGTAKRGSLVFAAVFLGANVWALINMARRILRMQKENLLYAGGKEGFVQDTIGSLLQTYLYGEDYGMNARLVLSYTVIGIFFLAGIWLTYRALHDRHIRFSAIVFTVLAIALLGPIAEHVLFGALFPLDRTALYYVPLFAVLVTSSASDLVSQSNRVGRILVSIVSVLIACATLVHFVRAANLTHTLMWSYDIDTKTAMDDIEALGLFRSGRHEIAIGNNWTLAPSINYYRMTRHYDWLKPATRDDPNSGNYDIVLCYPEDVTEAASHYSVVKRYPRTGLELLVARKSAETLIR